jgi:cyclopropane-fatty-acyl-phospholipid synthase
MALYLKLLEKNIKIGKLYLSLPDGKTHTFGNDGPEAHWIIHDEKALMRVARDWDLKLGETYMQQAWDVLDCSLYDLISLLRVNFKEYSPSKWLLPIIQVLQQWNRVSRSYRNVAHHYDLDEAFYRLFLDREMHYSCAYYASDNYNIHRAQQAKCEHIAKKLLLKPGMKVLDIGCGWGSLAIYLAEHHGVKVEGITLSETQLAVARRRAKHRGLEQQICFELRDYRDLKEKYDRIVSVGMFEHVGVPFYRSYFNCVNDLLRDDGVALIHTIGRSGPPGVTNAWILKYIFPGGGLPALSQIVESFEKAQLMLTDNEVLRIHYANTLRDWNARFQAHRDIARKARGESFCRMWEFYLNSCEVAFRCSDLVVFQLQMAKQHGVVPITRNYLHHDGELETMPRVGQSISNSVDKSREGRHLVGN